MPSLSPQQREIDSTASRAFTRLFLIAFGVAALIGLGIGAVWVVAGLLTHSGR
jgi:hypothetical protein